MISKASPHWSIYQKVYTILGDYRDYAQGILLDIGCGDKPFRDVFTPRIQQYIGIDIPSKIIRSNDASRLTQIDIYMDSISLGIKDESIDTAFSSFVVEHIFAYEIFFAEVYRVLKKQGNLILISPLMNEVHEIPYDYFRFTEYALRRIAAENGFSVLKIAPIGGEPLFWGNRIAVNIHKYFGSSFPLRFVELLSYAIQKATLSVDNRLSCGSFVCNYLSIFQKQH